jgi:hypothetical protein
MLGRLLRLSPYQLPVIFFIFVFALELAVILTLNRGRLVYTLDDPYIHLALAENIARGHYGINLNEPAAPASSILWPFLLAPFAWLPFADWVPLGINFVAALLTLIVVAGLVWTGLSTGPTVRAPLLAVVVTIFAIPALNLVGLAFTGMEHSLHVWLAVLVPLGLVREQETGRPPAWLLAAIAVGPLVRYESLALSVPALVYLAVRGHGRMAALTATPIVLVLGGFSAFLKSMGFGLLPSSVFSKSSLVSSHASPKAIYVNLHDNLFEREGALMGLACALFVAFALNPRYTAERRLFAASMGLATTAHLVFGAFGRFGRYEVYMWAASLVALFFFLRDPLARAFDHHRPLRSVAILGVFMGAVCFHYIPVMLLTPLASNNIYNQQYQMHRFITEFYRGPVAVNDLGRVSYGNEHYVLDLWGLGSESARVRREQSDDMRWIESTMQDHGIRLAMIYENWFPERPKSWRRVGQLKLRGTKVTPAENAVTLYAVGDSAYAMVVDAVNEFRETLPTGAEFVAAATSLPRPAGVRRQN